MYQPDLLNIFYGNEIKFREKLQFKSMQYALVLEFNSRLKRFDQFKNA